MHDSYCNISYVIYIFYFDYDGVIIILVIICIQVILLSSVTHDLCTYSILFCCDFIVESAAHSLVGLLVRWQPARIHLNVFLFSNHKTTKKHFFLNEERQFWCTRIFRYPHDHYHTVIVQFIVWYHIIKLIVYTNTNNEKQQHEQPKPALWWFSKENFK